MQVSWIDADRIKALVAQIAPEQASVEEAPFVMEIDTTPEPLPRSAAEAWGFAADWPEPVVKPVPVAAPTVAAAAETLAVEAEPPEPQPEREDETDDEEHGSPLHNSAAALPLSRIRDKLRAIRQRATEAGILTRMSEVVPPPPAAEKQLHEIAPLNPGGDQDETASDTATKMEAAFNALPLQAPVFEIPQGSRDDRLAAFASWARQLLHEDGGHVLVMSDDGEVLWGGEAKAGLVLSTMMAWGSAIRASAMSACETPPVIHQPLASGNVLTVIPCETAAGMVHAAVAAPAGLSHEMADILRGALCAALK